MILLGKPFSKRLVLTAAAALLLALGIGGTALASNVGFKLNSGIVTAVNRLLLGSGVSIGQSVDNSNHQVLEVNLDLQNQQFKDSDTLKFKLNLASLPESGFPVQGTDGSLYYLRECPSSGQLEIQLADVVVGNAPPSFWEGLNSPQYVALSADSLDIPTGAYALSTSLKVELTPGREYYSLFSHDFAQAQDWSCKKYLAFWFKGANSGVYHSLVLSNGTGYLSMYFVDDSDQWKLLIFDLQVPSTLDLTNVTHLVFAQDDKTIVETFRMQALHLLNEAP
ncbi:MAG: hypothetical protein HY676_03325 [Chloroflexi bacterium]|nr:hypothetical protein [Chloroflexota bacterium]